MNPFSESNRHKEKRRLPSELPFEASDEIIELISTISYKSRIQKSKELLLTHNCICQQLNIPLPFQSIGDSIFNGGTLEKIDIPELSTYNLNQIMFLK